MPHTLPSKTPEPPSTAKPNYLLRSTGAVFACAAGFLGAHLAFGYNGKDLMKEAAKPDSYVSVTTVSKINDFLIPYGRSDRSGQRLQSLAEEALKTRDFKAFDKFVAAGADGMRVDYPAGHSHAIQCRASHVGHAAADGNIAGLNHIATNYPEAFNNCAGAILGEISMSRDNHRTEVAAFFLDKGIKPVRP